MSKTRDILSSPRVLEIKRTKRNANIRISILCFVLLILSIVGLSFLSGYRKMTINQVDVIGTKILGEDEVRNFVNDKISGKYLYIFQRKNSFIYPQDSIYDGLLSRFTRIEKLSLNVKNVNTLEVIIKERSGSHMWCGAKVPESALDQGENCYFVNDEGYIFDKAPYVSGNLYFKYYAPLSDNKSVLGSQMINSDLFRSFVRLVEDVKSANLDPTYLVYEEDDTVSLYLKHKDGATNPRIIFKKDTDMKKVGEDIVTAMSQKEFKDEITGKYDTLLYIDMRFNNKVFYKFQ
ncbi:MAG: hypothetical protein WC089_01360 [Candidatus Paceibacterota bacterium]